MDLYHGDCLEIMKQLPDASVDFILTDPPYGTTKCKWDTIIPFGPMWAQLKRIRKPSCATLLFSKQPFTSILNNSNIEEFKQELIWKKANHDNPTMAKRRFLNVVENISCFYKAQPNFYPQGIIEINRMTKQGKGRSLAQQTDRDGQYLQTHTNYPRNILEFKTEITNQHKINRYHPTQKPVALLEYLIKTYTLEGETVLDFTMGSGSTGVACKNLNRKFIGIEQDEKYYQIACERVK